MAMEHDLQQNWVAGIIYEGTLHSVIAYTCTAYLELKSMVGSPSSVRLQSDMPMLLIQDHGHVELTRQYCNFSNVQLN